MHNLLLLYFTIDLNSNVSYLFGITLQLLMPVSWNVSGGSLQLYASLVSFLTFLTIMLVCLSFVSYILYKLEGFTLIVYILFFFFFFRI